MRRHLRLFDEVLDLLGRRCDRGFEQTMDALTVPLIDGPTSSWRLTLPSAREWARPLIGSDEG